MRRIALLVLALAFLLPLSAAPVLIDSGIETFLLGDAAAILIEPNSAWFTPGGAEWVSVAPCTGSGAECGGAVNVLANGTVASFFQTFTLSYGGSGSLTVVADDTANVYLDGDPVFVSPYFDSTNVSDFPTCSGGTIGCLPGTAATLQLTGLSSGTHTLQFDVPQRGAGSFGVAFAGSIEDVPEPATYGLVGFALVAGVAFTRRKRR